MPFSLRPYCRFPVPFLNLPLAYFLGFGSLIILLLLSNGPAYAEWVALLKNDEAGLTIYVNRHTIRRKGDMVKMWYLLDFKTIKTLAVDSFLSSKVQFEYYFLEERSRMLYMSFYSGHMGSGNVVSSDSADEKWKPVVPETRDQRLWNVACGKK